MTRRSPRQEGLGDGGGVEPRPVADGSMRTDRGGGGGGGPGGGGRGQRRVGGRPSGAGGGAGAGAAAEGRAAGVPRRRSGRHGRGPPGPASCGRSASWRAGRELETQPAVGDHGVKGHRAGLGTGSTSRPSTTTVAGPDSSSGLASATASTSAVDHGRRRDARPAGAAGTAPGRGGRRSPGVGGPRPAAGGGPSSAVGGHGRALDLQRRRRPGSASKPLRPALRRCGSSRALS